MSSKKDISSLFDRSGNLTPDAMQRYIRRQLEPEEVKAVEAHLESSPFDREAMEGLQKHPSDDLQQVLAGLDERINRAAKEKAGAPVLPMKRRINWAVAAGLLALIGLTVLLVFTFRSPVNEQLAVTTPGSSISKMESGKSKIDKQSTIDNQSKIENRKSKMDNQPVGGVAIKEEKKTPINRDVEQPNSIDKNLEPGTRNLEPKVQNPEPEAENLEPGTWNLEPKAGEPEPVPLTPEPETHVAMQSDQAPDSSVFEEFVIDFYPALPSTTDTMDFTTLAFKANKGEIRPFLVVEQMPEFAGGEDSLYSYIEHNLHYSDLAKTQGIEGTVYVRFIVDKTGKISNITIPRGIGGGCDEEAIRVVKEMPDWIPGKQNGTAVPVYFTLPIRFTLQ